MKVLLDIDLPDLNLASDITERVNQPPIKQAQVVTDYAPAYAEAHRIALREGLGAANVYLRKIEKEARQTKKDPPKKKVSRTSILKEAIGIGLLVLAERYSNVNTD